MPKTKTAKTREKHSVQIIMVGVAKAVIHLINLLHLADIAKVGDWIEVNWNRATNKLTMTPSLSTLCCKPDGPRG
ncbi:MAG: hypothetical protein GDA48_26860 [Hormoscilla sp. GM102CHS1]|nr:hypothetical protein [Hormoscilla sp. GM102CHS1]